MPLTAAGPPAVRFALGSLIVVTVSFTVAPLTAVFAVTTAWCRRCCCSAS